MTFENDANATSTPAILTPEVQQAVWFLGALVRVRTGGDSTAGSLAVLEHQAERGYASPVDRHLADGETFFVLDGELRVEVGGEAHASGLWQVHACRRSAPDTVTRAVLARRRLADVTPRLCERPYPAGAEVSFVIITASSQLNGTIRAATPYGSRCNRG